MIKFKYISLLFATWLLMAVNLVGQNISINADGTAADNSAMLDVTSTNRGMLVPRMTAAQRIAIPSPANGLLVFQTDVPRGFYAYFAATTVWTRLSVDTILNLEGVLQGGNNANNDSILNLGALGIGTLNPVGSIQIDSFAIIQGKPYGSGFRWFGFNVFHDGVSAEPERMNNGKAAIFAQGAGRTTIGHFGFGSAGNPVGNALSAIELRDSSVEIGGEAVNFEIDLRGIVTVDSFNIANNYHFPSVDGNANQILQTDGAGTLSWSTVSGDNLGNHVATTNIELNGNYLSGDGDNEGIYIDNSGNVGIGTASPSAPLTINTLAGTEIEFRGLSNSDIVSPTQLNISSAASTFIDASEIILRTNLTERLRILNNGNVGVGTNSPLGKMEVAGDGSLIGGLRVSGTTAATVGSSIYFDAASKDWTITATNSGASAGADKLIFRDYSTASDRMTIDGTGNVGIGTTNPNAELEVIGDVLIPAANDYTYRTPKTNYYSISAAAFTPLQGQSGNTTTQGLEIGGFLSGNSRWIAGGNILLDAYMYAPVNLPHGARITEITFYVFDTDLLYEVSGELYRQTLGSTVSTLIASTPGTGLLGVPATTSLSATANHVVDNDSYSYYCRFNTKQNNASLRIFGVKITYTVLHAD